MFVYVFKRSKAKSITRDVHFEARFFKRGSHRDFLAYEKRIGIFCLFACLRLPLITEKKKLL